VPLGLPLDRSSSWRADFYPVWSFTYSGSNLAGKNIQHGLDRLNLPQNSLHNAGADTTGGLSSGQGSR
jgi:hypothetical protein